MPDWKEIFKINAEKIGKHNEKCQQKKAAQAATPPASEPPDGHVGGMEPMIESPTAAILPQKPSLIRFVMGKDLQGPTTMPYLIQGFLPEGRLTMLAAQYKAGKSTMLSVMAANMVAGKNFAGLETKLCRVTYLSEEMDSDWTIRRAKLPDLGKVRFAFTDSLKPTHSQWAEMIATVGETIEADQDDTPELLIVDTLANLSSVSDENSNDEVPFYLRPLRELTTNGITVLAIDHMGHEGTRARGGSSKGGYGDFNVTMPCDHPDDPHYTERTLFIKGRAPDKYHKLKIALAPDGMEYLMIEKDGPDAAKNPKDANLQEIAVQWFKIWDGQMPDFSVEFMLENWPDDVTKPTLDSLKNAVAKAHLDGKLIRTTPKASKGNPHRYHWASDGLKLAA